ncbi:MAG: sel1 repeat family protein [Nitrospinota bacterium]|nr:sel1 repeat family protein [Nitrospinota bacterium]
MIDSEKLFINADKEWDKGNLKVAFKLFFESAKEGHEGSQNSLGVFYECGLGIKKNPKKALYWYKKAAKKGSEPAMSNIAVYYFKRGNPTRAKFWYKRAIKAGDGNAALEMAKVYLSSKPNKHNTKCAVKYLKKALKCVPYEGITPDGYEEAEKLMADIQRIK